MGFKLKILDSYPQGIARELILNEEFGDLFPVAQDYLKQNIRNIGAEVFIWEPNEKILGLKHTREGLLPLVLHLETEYRKLLEQKKSGIIFRHALSKAFDKKIPIFDVTGGLLGDTLMLSLLYDDVTTFEKDVAINVLILEEMRGKNFTFKFMAEEATIKKLTEVAAGREIQIFFDPMYEEKNESAQTSKGMQFLRDRADKGLNREDFFIQMRELSFVKKMVVKRSIKAASIGPSVHHSFEGKSTVFDVY